MKKLITFISLFLLGPSLLYAQVGIGTVTPDENAILEVSSSNRGFLMPRIALTALNDPSPMNAHVAGMTVYNTVTSGTGENRVTPGFYVNNGSGWRRTGNDARSEARWVNKTGSVVLLNLSDGATERPVGTEFVALDNGNLGIGTKTPTDKLTLNIGSYAKGIVITGSPPMDKSFTFDSIAQNGQGAINWKKPNSNTLSASIRTVGSETFGRKGIAFFTGNQNNTTSDAVEQMQIFPDGRLAIKNTSSYNPNARMGIEGNQKLTGLNVEGIKVNYSTKNYGFITYSNNFTIQTTGVEDTLTFTAGRAIYLKASASNAGGIHLKTGNVTRMEVIGGSTSGYGGIAIYDENSNVTAKFTEEGKVGIATATPQEKLDITGAIKFESGGYTSISHNATSPVPAGGAGTIVFFNSSFFGFNGTEWKKLEN